MGILQALLGVLNTTDAILGPRILDLTPTTLTIEVRTYAAGLRSTQGSYSVTSSLALPGYVQTRLVTTKEIADTGGRYEAGEVIAGPIRPQFATSLGQTGGFTQAQIDPAPTLTQDPVTHQGVDVVYILAQENATMGGLSGEYSLVEFKHDDPFEYMIRLRRRLTTP